MRFRNVTAADFEFISIVIFSIVMYLTVFLDIPVARQIVGFIFLTTIPGFIIIRLLKVTNLDRAEIVLFSVGLSIAFLMIAGLIWNEIAFLFDISKPLSSVFFNLFLGIFVLAGGLFVFLRNNCFAILKIEKLKVSWHAVLFLIPPLFAFLGSYWANVSGSTLMLLLLLVIIAVIFILGVFSRFITYRMHVIVTLVISFSLLFHSSLISNFLQGHDIHLEFYVAKLVQNEGKWINNLFPQGLDVGRLGSMLSITILPAIYSNILNMELSMVLKIIFPVLFSFVPLTLYKVWSKNFGGKVALTSAFVLISELTFYTEMLALTRQMVAELFLVLLFFLILDKKTINRNKKLCFIIFSFALIVSHYAIAVLFGVFIFFYWVCIFLLMKVKTNFNLDMVLIFFTAMFSWYIFVSNAASFNSLLSFGEYVYGGLNDFFSLSSRGEGVLRGIGLDVPESYVHAISRAFAYALEFFIVIGFFASIVWRRKRNINREYSVLSLLSMSLIVLCILLPNFAQTLRMERFFHLSLLLLAPFFVIGCETIAEVFLKRRTATCSSILIAIILVPFFLFQTGFIYEVANVRTEAVSLSKYRMSKIDLVIGGHVNELDAFSARWLPRNMNLSQHLIYADVASQSHVLTSYGLVPRERIKEFTNVTIQENNSMLYLSELNACDKVVVGRYLWNITQIPIDFNDLNKIYSNGGSEIYKTP